MGDFLLLALLSFNLVQLVNLFTKTQAILNSNILSDNPEAFLSQITANGVSGLMWFVNIGSLVLTVVFIVLLFIPKFQLKKIAIANVIWLGAWLLYIVVSLIILAVVAMSVLSFT